MVSYLQIVNDFDRCCFDTIECLRPNHPEDVFQSMERIMTLIVNESDGLLPLGALTVLLANARKENKVTLL